MEKHIHSQGKTSVWNILSLLQKLLVFSMTEHSRSKTQPPFHKLFYIPGVIQLLYTFLLVRNRILIGCEISFVPKFSRDKPTFPVCFGLLVFSIVAWGMWATLFCCYRCNTKLLDRTFARNRNC